MRNLFKIFLLSLCVLALSSTVIYANADPDLQKAAEVNRIQPASVDDLTYLLLVWTGSNLFPSYFPQLEFKAGYTLRVTAASSNWSELTGIWTEVEFGDLFSYFTAQVEQEDPPTTTTISIPPAERENLVQPLGTKMIDLWGISFTIVIPEPFNIGLSILLGAGTYLGKNAVFSGVSGVTIGDKPEFGSVSPNEGEQGQTLEVKVTGRNTTFENASTIIQVDFGEGIEVGPPGVRNDTELRVDITIADSAQVGVRTVSVTYDNTVISEANVFTVLEKTQ